MAHRHPHRWLCPSQLSGSEPRVTAAAPPPSRDLAPRPARRPEGLYHRPLRMYLKNGRARSRSVWRAASVSMTSVRPSPGATPTGRSSAPSRTPIAGEVNASRSLRQILAHYQSQFLDSFRRYGIALRDKGIGEGAVASTFLRQRSDTRDRRPQDRLGCATLACMFATTISTVTHSSRLAPAVIVRYHSDGAVVHLCLASEFGLGSAVMPMRSPPICR